MQLHGWRHDGQLHRQITSATAGTTVVSATSDISVDGQSITRTTGTAVNTTAGGSGNATKLWADDTVRTDILNSQDQVVTSGGSGLVVHDKAFVSRDAGTPAARAEPDGNRDVPPLHQRGLLGCLDWIRRLR